MLWQRVVTALLLLPLVLGAIFFLPNAWFAPVIAIPVLLAGREWASIAKLCGYTFPALLVLGMVGTWAIEQRVANAASPLLWIAAIFWIANVVVVVKYPAITGWAKNRAFMYVAGLVVLLPAWYAVVKLQGFNSPEQPYLGSALLLGGMVIVWGADVGAYFAGRTFGKRKLAPRVSPGKSVEGAIGGMLLTLALGFGVAAYLGYDGAWTLQVLALVFACTLASIHGDLYESLIKREAGVKDSGTLLPGHGGMLDRIDSVTCALPAFALGLQILPLA